jgi:TetR/AcrR family transcriptional repressor of nem operon
VALDPIGRPSTGARVRLLDAGVDVIRARGLSATTVDELCAVAGVTKGAFFHHFDSKETFAVAAADHWSATTSVLFEQAAYHDHDDPVDRVLGYVDLRAAMIVGTLAEFSCLVGTMSQEAFETSPAVRDACGASILGHAATLEGDIAEALGAIDPDPGTSASSLARHTQVVLQGAFVVSKAANDPAIAVDSIAHLRRYLEYVFQRTPTRSES